MIDQGADLAIYESSTTGPIIGRMTGRKYECMSGRLALYIRQPIYQRKNGPIDGPLLTRPLNPSKNESTAAKFNGGHSVQDRTIQQNAINIL